MTGLALALALEIAARLSGLPPFRVPVPTIGVDLRQELRQIRWTPDLRLLTHAYAPKTIALTFDDGPHATKTPALLRMLRDLDVKATFFVVGKMVDKNPWLVRLELQQGHEVGNHTYHHYSLEDLTDPQIAFEYKACSDAIYHATGYRPHFCRPPGGRFDNDIVKIASDQGMWTVLWTDDPGDFARPNPKVLAERVDRQMRNGGILLLHDGIPQTLQVLPELVQELRKRGYKFVTCSQLLLQRNRSIMVRRSAEAASTPPRGR